MLEAEFGERGLIGITQPRKVAATSLATRVAAEQAATLGHLVGYSVRFDEKCGRDTRIKYLTDGMLVRELLSDRLLSQYSVLIIDEAHERTLRTDLLLSSLKSIQKERNGAVTTNSNDRKGKHRETTPLKVIIMSATLDAERFSRFFDKYAIFTDLRVISNPPSVPRSFISRDGSTPLLHISPKNHRRILWSLLFKHYSKFISNNPQEMYWFSYQVRAETKHLYSRVLELLHQVKTRSNRWRSPLSSIATKYLRGR